MSPVDFDLHGLVGVRLLQATAREARMITRQIGPLQAALEREPDITIRFVERLPVSGRLRALGLDDAAYSDDAFLLLRGKHKSPIRVQIPLEQVGRCCEIVCERGLPAVPLLLAIINLTALAKGALPLHASAFIYQGQGMLATGWAKGGKTETLLAYMAQGATYVGDEWVYLRPEGEEMLGIPEPIRIWDWHLDHLPRYRAALGRGERARLGGLKLVTDGMDWASANGVGRALPPVKLMGRLSPPLKRQRNVQVAPATLFGAENCALASPLHKIFFVGSHDSPEVTVEPMATAEIARRMVFSLQEERKELLSAYLKFRFAFPDRSNQLLEQAEARQLEALSRALAGKEAYAVFHPYPVEIPRLFEAIEKRRMWRR